ncbi:hypothetical protein CLCR_05788 [Cladophialophora carrionii]|uniref:Uncharacterized protein n=1 Tax=Cladophialophora carrionii TaxID=86049 RepID=A0A1C1C8B8_9EURO|nr:hypothetical protein CLCR_05788 [Cladophialophora carrionii]
MPEITIRGCLTSLGFHYPSTLYKSVKRDITAFLRASVDLPYASDELLRHTADRYLTHTQSYQASASWDPTITKLLHWATEEKRTEKQDLICDVMKLMQRNALETIHKKPCTGCRNHPQPITSASATTTTITAPATISVRQSPLSNMSAPPVPWLASDVERDGIASGLPLPEEQLSHESTRSPHSPSRRSDSISSVLPWADDPYDSDYTDARPPRKRKRVPATSHVRSSLPQPPVDQGEAVAPEMQGTILVAPSPRATATPGLDQQQRRPSEVKDPQPQASKAKDTQQEQRRSEAKETQQEQQTSAQAKDPEELQQTAVQAKAPQAPIGPDVSASASASASTSASSPPSSLELRGRRWVFGTAAEKIKGLEAARARQHALLESFVQERGDDSQVKSVAAMLSHHSKTLDMCLTQAAQHSKTLDMWLTQAAGRDWEAATLVSAGRDWEAETLVSVLTRQLDIGEWLLREICGDDKALLRKRIWELDSQTEKCFVENGGDPVR